MLTILLVYFSPLQILLSLCRGRQVTLIGILAQMEQPHLIQLMPTQLVRELGLSQVIICFCTHHILEILQAPLIVSTIMVVADPSMVAELVGEIGVSPFGMSKLLLLFGNPELNRGQKFVQTI
jgi:hypothetical protein